jgi:DNA-binding CsgD family transcriptional regulator
VEALIGRKREIEELTQLIDHVIERGEAVLVRGAAGIGKSALLTAARAHAADRGMRTLYANGVQSETQLAFAGLHQLLRPFLDDSGDLPEPQRDAFLAAFGMAPATRDPNLFLVALAVLNLLSGAAAHAPLLVVVDDVQWLDRSSCDVLAFLARRLESDPILLLCALRDGFASALNAAGVTELRLEGLDDLASATLLDTYTSGLDPATRTRLLENAAGHPLALIELPKAIRTEGYDGDAPLPPWLPLTERLERAFSMRAAELPPMTRRLLLIASADESGALAEILTAAAMLADGATISEEDLDPGTQAGLIDLAGASIRFRHPLIRSALYQAATAAQRREVHVALASALADQPARAIWHRAACIVGQDEQLASELAEAANQAMRQGASSVAVTALERAAQLSNNPTQQSGWLLEAASTSLMFDLDLARRLLRNIELLDLPAPQREEALWLREVYIGLEQGRPWSGVARVRPRVELAEQARLEGNTGGALLRLWDIAIRCFWANADQETRDLVVAAAERLPCADTDPMLMATLACVAPIERGATVLERFSRVPTESQDPIAGYLYGFAAIAVGAFDRAAAFFGPAIDGLRLRALLQHVSQGLVALALATRYSGQWQIAAPAADEATRLGRETGQGRWAAAAQAIGAAVDGLRGETVRAEASAREAEAVLRNIAAHPMLALVQLARGAAALTARRYDEAFEQLWRVFDPTDIVYHPVVRCWAIADLAEAAIHSGHIEQARAVAQEMESLANGSPFPVLLAGLHAARPLLAKDDEAEALFLAGLDADLTNLALARERLQLAYGAWLRRQRRVIESRTWLRTARDALDAYGAIPWAEYARQELRASGETSPRHEPAARDRLTSQELQIALLASEGLSNREIGQRLFLSPRTVGFYLYKIFPKLGISSRAQLSTALGFGRSSL